MVEVAEIELCGRPASTVLRRRHSIGGGTGGRRVR